MKNTRNIKRTKNLLLSTSNLEPDIKRPQLSDDGSFYIVYSPEKRKLRPKDSTLLNLRLKLSLPETIEAMVGLFPSFVSRKL